MPEYESHIVQSLAALPDIASWPPGPVVIDTETSGLSPHHGHRLCGIALCHAADPSRCFYLPLRHVGVSSRASGSTPGRPALQGPVGDDGLPPGDYQNLPVTPVLDWLRVLAADLARTWVMHNAEFDLGIFRADGIEFAGVVTDTMVMAHGIRGDRMSYALDALSEMPHPWSKKLEAWLRIHQTEKIVSLSTAGDLRVQKDYSRVPIELLGPYACEDIFATATLYARLKGTRLVKGKSANQGHPSQGQLELLRSDRELVRVLFEMSWAGVKMDMDAIAEAREDARSRAVRCYLELVEVSGGIPFNAQSNKQLSRAFEASGGRIRYWMKKEDERGKQKAQAFTTVKENSTGTPCWNAAALFKYLEQYQDVRPDPLGALAGMPPSEASKPYRFLVAYRNYSQLLRLCSTYLDTYLKVVDVNGILHGHFDPTGTVTGRLSSRNPNLQNVTKTEENADEKALDEVMDDSLLSGSGLADDFRLSPFYQYGRLLPEYVETDQAPLAKRIRSFFIPRKSGNWIVAIDYSSIEYRVAAYLTGDKTLIEAFKANPDLDFHQYCAELIWGTTADDKQRKTWRGLAKTVNFGTLYGMGDGSLASVLRKSLAEAKSIRTRLFAKIPAMKVLINQVRINAVQQGYVQNPLGRVCYVPSDRTYIALNYLDQGFAADALRRALVRVRKMLVERGWVDGVSMILTVHDEVVFDMPQELVFEVSHEIAKVMCDVPEIGLPLTVEIEVGRNWGELEKLDDWVLAHARELSNAKGVAA